MSEEKIQNITKLLRYVPDFPKKGINFVDISTLICDPVGLKDTINLLAEHYKGQKIDYVCGLESRGFIFGTALAVELGCGFVMMRKPGKLPYKTVSVEYSKEYGTDKIEVNIDAFKEGSNVLIVDDLIATGGSLLACIDLVEKLKAKPMGCCCVIELEFLKGRELIEKKAPLFCLIKNKD